MVELDSKLPVPKAPGLNGAVGVNAAVIKALEQLSAKASASASASANANANAGVDGVDGVDGDAEADGDGDTDRADSRMVCLDDTKLRHLTKEDGVALSLPTLEELTLNVTLLRSLDNWPRLPELKSVELMDNRLADDVDFSVLLQSSPKLRKVLLANNKIAKLETVARLLDVPGNQISILSLEMNPLCEPDDGRSLRQALFARYPNLRCIDCLGPDGREADETDASIFAAAGEDEGQSGDSEESGSDDSGDSESDSGDSGDSGDDEVGKGRDQLREMYFKEYEADDDEEDEDFVPAGEGPVDADGDGDGNWGKRAMTQRQKRGRHTAQGAETRPAQDPTGTPGESQVGTQADTQVETQVERRRRHT